MSRSIRIGLSIVFAAACVAQLETGSLPTAFAQEAEAAGECVGFALAESKHGLEYELANECEVKLRCAMSWKLVCGDERKGPTHHGSKQVFVEPSQSANIAISVAACGSQSWSVEHIVWSCDPA